MTIDPTEFRDAQRTQWDKAATGWDKWSGKFEETTDSISIRLNELAGVEAGTRVLDVAAGYGATSIVAGRIAGADGKVVSTDISSEMLQFGRKHAANAGLDNIEFVEGAAARNRSLPLGAHADGDGPVRRPPAPAGHARPAQPPHARANRWSAGGRWLRRRRGRGGRARDGLRIARAVHHLRARDRAADQRTDGRAAARAPGGGVGRDHRRDQFPRRRRRHPEALRPGTD